jgi:hypothetical protein
VKYAQSKGCLVRKLNGMGFPGWPDRMFLYRGQVLFLELKREGGGKLSALQAKMIGELRAQGFAALVVDNVPLGKRLIDALVAGTPRGAVDADGSMH